MSAFADFQFKELVKASEWPPASKQNVIKLDLPRQLTDRRIYLYAEVKQSSAGNFTFLAELVLYRAGELKAKYPIELAVSAVGATNLQRSAHCLANGGGSPVGDCLTLVLATPFSATTMNAVLQPIRINGEVDSAVININDVSGNNNTGYRLYLGVLSQAN